MDILDDEIESILYLAREVMVYQIPPRTSADGYKAADWNVENFIWKGRLRVMEIGTRCELRLEDSGTGELFAQVNYAKPFTQVEPVLDSSRYFVLRVEGEAGKVAYIGMGFQERGDAFDFQTVSKRGTNPQSGSSSSSEPAKPIAPPKDYSLKDGQTFKIAIPGRDGKKVGASGAKGASGSLVGQGGGSSGGGGGGLFSLPPPPPPGRR